MIAFLPLIVYVVLSLFQSLVLNTVITRGRALRFTPRLPLATFLLPLRGASLNGLVQ